MLKKSEKVALKEMF